MYFGFALDASAIELWDIDLLDTELDLLDTDIPSKHFVCLQDIFKMFWRHVLKTYLLQDGFSLTIFRLPRHLQDILWDVFKTSLKRVRRWKIVTLKMCWRRIPGMSWRRLQDIFKTNKCLLGCIWNILMIFLVCMHFFSLKMVHEYIYVR